jgi:hypothetical protein
MSQTERALFVALAEAGNDPLMPVLCQGCRS